MKDTTANDCAELGDLAIDLLRLQIDHEYRPRGQRNSAEYKQLGRDLKALRTGILRVDVDMAILREMIGYAAFREYGRGETFDLAMRVFS